MKPLVDVQNLKKYFPIEAGLFRSGIGWIRAVDDVTFYIKKGTVMGLVGESGCGKTTVGKTIMLLQKPTEGKVYFDGDDIGTYDKIQLRALRKRQGIIYQDPHSSLNPRMTVVNLVGRPLVIQGIKESDERVERVASMIEKVGLNPEHLGRYPHEFSGGQKQRIAIARALITNPDFVVLDEPTSALDVSVQAQILKLLQELQNELKLTYLFISHDIAVVRYMSDMMAVMYVGKLAEWGTKQQVFDDPLHPYTQALLSVVPIPDPKVKHRERTILSGDVPSPKNPPSGCRFHPRCPQAFEPCSTLEPQLKDQGNNHYVACHLYNSK